MSYKLQIFFRVCYAKYFFKNTVPKNEKILFLLCQPTDPNIFLLPCPLTKKLTCFLLTKIFVAIASKDPFFKKKTHCEL